MTSRIRFRSSHQRIAPLHVSHHSSTSAKPARADDDFGYMRDRDTIDERLVQGQRGKKHPKKQK